MEVTYKMRATTNEIYDAIMQSVLLEFSNDTGKNLSMQQIINGYSYKHKMKHGKLKIDVTTKLKQPLPNKNVHLTLVYPTDSFEMDYKFDYIDDNHTLVTYNQFRKPVNKEGWVFINKMVFKRRLQKIERYIGTIRKQKNEEN